MAKMSPQAFSEKWSRNMSQAGPYIQAGVEAVTEAPGVKAAQKADKMLARLTESVQSGKWAARVSSVDVNTWKKATIEKGLGRISAGVQAAKPKVQQFAEELLPFEESLKAQIEKMPDVTQGDSEARMLAWMRGMSEFRRTR